MRFVLERRCARLQAQASSYASASQSPIAGAWIWIALGSIARIAWPRDFEWKYDEKWMFDTAVRVARSELPWPWLGMPSGAGVQNAGASTWPFIGFAHVTRDPASMALLVMLANVIALWAFAFWVHKGWDRRHRALGMWGVALFAVSPLPVLFARKIWAQSMLPVLLVPWLFAHMKRDRAAAAFAWGALGALLGQLHLSGFFAAAGLVIATAVLDDRRTHWRAWLLGSAIAALPLLPWLSFSLAAKPTYRERSENPVLEFASDAILNGWGLNLRASLGEHFQRFLSGPIVAGTATWLVLAAHVLLVVLAATGIVLATRKHHPLAFPPALRVYALAIAVSATAMHALEVKVYSHYMIVFSPLLHLFVAWLLLQRQRLVWLGCGLQLFITTAFLCFIHDNGGAARADYGVAYGVQTATERAFEGNGHAAR